MNTIRILALALALATAGAAQAAPRTTYFNAQGAIADVENLDNGLSGIFALGFPLSGVDPNLSIEGEFSTSLLPPETSRGRDFTYFTLGGFAAYRVPVNETVALRGRAGLFYQDWEVSNAGSDDDIGLGFGVGATVKIDARMDFIGEVTVLEGDDPDINHFSAGIQYRF